MTDSVDALTSRLTEFLAESLRIEGIHRAPSQMEIDATARFMRLFAVSATSASGVTWLRQAARRSCASSSAL